MDPNTQSETLDQLQDMNGGLGEVLPQGTPVEAVEQEAAPIVEEETFEVDGQKFANEKAAFDYLKVRNSELEAERMVESARIEGMQEALRYAPAGHVPQQVQQQVADDPSMDADEFYANPVEYMAKQRERIKAEVMNEVTSSQTKAQAAEKVWSDFSTRFPELADQRDIVDLIALQHKETVRALAARDSNKAYDFVATKVKSKLQSYVESLRPARELASSKGGVSSGGNQVVTSAAQNTNNDKPLDFISQIKQNRRR